MFKRKKKPWDYKTYREKVLSIQIDYSEDEKVLKKVVKDNSDIDVRIWAMIPLFTLKGVSNEPNEMFNFLVKNVGLSENDAANLLDSFYKKYQKFEESDDKIWDPKKF